MCLEEELNHQNIDGFRNCGTTGAPYILHTSLYKLDIWIVDRSACSLLIFKEMKVAYIGMYDHTCVTGSSQRSHIFG